jgi:hypothetical protein
MGLKTFSDLSCTLCGRRLDNKLFAGNYTQNIVNIAVECPYCKTIVTIRAKIHNQREGIADVIDGEVIDVVEQKQIER